MVVSVPTNGTHHVPTANGKATTGSSATPRCPRRIVLLQGDERSEIDKVLAEYEGTQVSGRRLHEDVRRQAAQHPGQQIAAEWLGPLGWTRFLWCWG
jgi:hypothetical protein